MPLGYGYTACKFGRKTSFRQNGCDLNPLSNPVGTHAFVLIRIRTNRFSSENASSVTVALGYGYTGREFGRKLF